MLLGVHSFFSSKLGTGILRSSWVSTLQFAITLLAAVGLFAAPALAQSIRTVTNTTDVNDGSCSAGACSLRDAITAANADSGDRIVFASNVAGTITLTSTLNITAPMTITGPGPNLLTVSGGGAVSVFNVSGGTAATPVAISGLTIANGYTSGNGGGIYNAGTLKVTNSGFSGNSAWQNCGECGGGGIYNTGTGSLTVSNSTFSGNSGNSTQGGGGGGGIFNDYGGTVTVANSTFSGNSGGADSGAIHNNSTLTVINSTFFGNSAPNGGGGITNNGTLKVTNSTFSGNTSTNHAGGIYNTASLTVTNSILSGNTGGDCGGDNGAGCPTIAGNGNAVSVSNINLAPLGWNGGYTQTMIPLPGSAAICGGLSSLALNASGNALATDQRGFGFNNAACSTGQVDAGAVQSNYLTVTTLTDSNDGSCTASSCSLRDALTAANSTYPSGTDITFLPSLFLSGSPAVATPGTINLSTGTNTQLPAIAGNVNLAGPGANLLTVSGGGFSSPVGSVFSVASTANAAISGITITRGYGNGSVLYSSGLGGGIFNGGGILAVSGCSITSNLTAFAGGGAIFNAGALTVFGSTIANNSNTVGIFNGGGVTGVMPIVVLTNSTVTGNTNSFSGGGIDNNAYDGWPVLIVNNSTIAGNSTNYLCYGCSNTGGGIYSSEANGTVVLTNSIVAGNFQWQQSGSIADDCTDCGTQSAYNLIGGTPALGSLGYSPATATVQTMMPLPGGTGIIGAGSAALLPAGLTTDERGFPRLTGGTLDLGAAQTNYTSVGFVQQPTNVVAGNVITPAPTVAVYETNSITNATDQVAGIPVTLSLNGAEGGVTGTLTETTVPTAASGDLATFPDQTGNVTGSYSFTVSSPQIGSTVATSNSFSVLAVETQLAFGIAPPSPVQAGGNAGTVTVLEESSSGTVVTTAGDQIALTVRYPDGTMQSYSATASSGVATFVLSGAALTEAGQYTYAVSLAGVSGATAYETVIAGTKAVGLAVTGYPKIAYAGLAGTAKVTAVDAYGNLVTSMNGTVNITTSDKLAIVSTPIQMTSGAGTATVAFATVGRQIITASASGLAIGSETNITVRALPSYVVTVNTDTTTGVASNCPGSNCSLRDALAAALVSGGSITFDTTAFATAETITLANGPLMIPPNTVITGPTMGSGTTLTNLVTVDGANSFTVFTNGWGNQFPDFKGLTAFKPAGANPIGISFATGAASISNLNIQNGNGGVDGYGGPGSSGGAGGINNYGALTVTHCTFATNTGTDAGAIYNWYSQLAVVGSTFTGNSSSGGWSDGEGGWYGDAGAIFNDDYNPDGGTFGEVAGANGSVHSLATRAAIHHRAHGRGRRDNILSAAGIPANADFSSSPASGSLTVTNSTFTGNSGVYTGGIFNYSTMTVDHSTFGGTAAGAGNTSSGDGEGDPDAGALNNDTDEILVNATVTNSTFTNNSGTLGGAIVNADDDEDGATLQVAYSTFNGNTSSGDGNGDPDAGAITSMWGSTAEVANSTFFQNSSTSNSGAGAFANFDAASFAVYGATITSNSGYYGGVYNVTNGQEENGNETNILNSIVSGNTTTDPTASSDGIASDNNGFFYKTKQGDIIGASAIDLAPLGNYGGPTQTMIPLPTSTAICAANYAMLHVVYNNVGATLTKDQRGQSNTNASYPGYTADAPCVDAGAVQTHYALNFSTEPPAEVTAGMAFSRIPVVALKESGVVATHVSGSISMTDSASLLGGTTSASLSSGLATFSNLTITSATSNDTLTAALALNSSLNLTAASTAVTAIPTQTITFPAITGTQYASSQLTLSATASSGLPVSFSSTTPSVCTASGTTLSLLIPGTCVVHASQPGDAAHAAAPPLAQSFAVHIASQTLTFQAITGTQYALSQLTLTATASSGLPVSFTSITPTVCSVSGSNLSLLISGTCVVHALQAGNNVYSSAPPLAQSFAVHALSQTITFQAITGTQYALSQLTLTARASSGLTVSFTSTTPSVCYVLGSTLSLLTKGTCVLHAVQAGNNVYSAAPPLAQSFAVKAAVN
jgi:CSLREA domain-containing protein